MQERTRSLAFAGYGRDYVAAVIDFACRSFAPTQLRVTIAELNLRAQRV
jgi:hypothetical protein